MGQFSPGPVLWPVPMPAWLASCFLTLRRKGVLNHREVKQCPAFQRFPNTSWGGSTEQHGLCCVCPVSQGPKCFPKGHSCLMPFLSGGTWLRGAQAA